MIKSIRDNKLFQYMSAFEYFDRADEKGWN